MRFFKAYALLFLVSLSAQAAQQAVLPYSCEDPPLRMLTANTSFVEDFRSFSQESDPEKAQAQSKKLNAQAKTGAERTMAKLASATVLSAQGLLSQAEPLLIEVLNSEHANRDVMDAARLSLGRAAMDRNDMDAVIHWLAPIAEARCKSAPNEVHKQLAFAYQEKKEYQKALEQVDQVKFGSPESANRWRAIRLDLRCQIEQAKTCFAEIREAAAAGLLADESLAVAQRQIKRIGATAEGALLIDEARAAGWIDQAGEVVVSQLDQIVPLKAVAPRYPKRAVGINGYVDLKLVINPDGSVKSAEVHEARPPGYFEKAAIAAARASTFKPKIINGKAVEAQGIRRYNFRMSR